MLNSVLNGEWSNSVRGRKIPEGQEQRLLGVILDRPMPLLIWREHIQYIILDGYRRVNLMNSLSSTSWGASSKILCLFYVAYIRSKMEYASVMFTGVVTPLKHKLKVI